MIPDPGAPTRLLALGSLLALAAGGPLVLMQQFDPPKPQGDELFYLKHAPVVAVFGDHSLIPGRLGFGEGGLWRAEKPALLDALHHRAPLALNVFAFLVPGELLVQTARRWMDIVITARSSTGEILWERPLLTPGTRRWLGRKVEDLAGSSTQGPDARTLFLQRVLLLQLVLFLATLICLYAQGRMLGVGPRGALVAPLLLAISPWFVSYANSAFAEPLRTALLNIAFVFLLAYLRRHALVLLVPAGLVAGYAVLARPSFLYFMLVSAVIVTTVTWIATRSSGLGRRAFRTLAAGALFGGCLLAVVGPQLYANGRAGIGLRLSTNTVRNLDLALRSPPPSDPGRAAWWAAAKADYFASAPTYREREEAARVRLRNFLREVSIPVLIHQQAAKLQFVLFHEDHLLDRGIARNRWGDRSPLLEWLPGVSRVHSIGLLALGVLGLLWIGWRSPGWVLLSAFALYYTAALFVVPITPRFVVPLLPTLAMLSAGFLVSLSGRHRACAGAPLGCPK